MSDRDDGLLAAGARLKAWRDAEDISQEVAANRIRASQAAWAAWERGEKGPDLHYAFELEKLTGDLADGAFRVLASEWAFPRKGSRAEGPAPAEQTGPQPSITAATVAATKATG